MPAPAVMDDFRAYAADHKVKFTPEEWESDHSWIAERLRDQLFITAFSKEESDQVVLENDPEVKKAVESLPSSKALLDKAHDVIAKQSVTTTQGSR